MYNASKLQPMKFMQHTQPWQTHIGGAASALQIREHVQQVASVVHLHHKMDGSVNGAKPNSNDTCEA